MMSALDRTFYMNELYFEGDEILFLRITHRDDRVNNFPNKGVC